MPASAVVAYVDDFSVTKNGTMVFRDTFSDGAPPPSAPDFLTGGPANYFVNGSFAPNSESGGKLRANSADGVSVISANGFENLALTSILNTNIDPNNLINGLKIDDTLILTGLFDLIPNGGPLYSGYGIGFNDGGNNLGRRNEMNLQVQYSTTLGVDILRLNYQDFDNGTVTTVAAIPVDLSLGADQILLSLSRPDVNTFDLFASYSYLSNGQVIGGGALGSTSIFQDRNYVRGYFFSANVQAVPEPSALALLGLSVAGLVAVRRRAKR
jgi:hypothetical protein